MIKRLFLATAILSTAVLAGCANIPGFTVPTIAQVQDATIQACKFIPTATTVSSIIAAATAGPAGSAIAVTAGSVAQSVCAALENAPKLGTSRLGVHVPVVTVNGKNIPVYGSYVKK